MKNYDIFWQMFRNGNQEFAAVVIRQEIERQVEIMLPQIVEPLIEKAVKDYLSNLSIQTDIRDNVIDQIYKLLK